MTRQKLGQHFLKDRKKAEKIAHRLLRNPGPVLEIGPGAGALTDILDREGEGRHIVSVEKDPALIPPLEAKGYSNVNIVSADILETDPAALFDTVPVNLLGNIPYMISKEITDWIIGNGSVFSLGVLMVQKEFFLKITSVPGSKLYNAQSVMFNTLFETKKLFDVPPGSFSPPPAVTSTVFIFRKREQAFPNFKLSISNSKLQKTLQNEKRAPDSNANSKFKTQHSTLNTESNWGQVPFNSEFYRFLKAAFRNRRKTLLNNLGGKYDKGSIRQFLESESLSTAIRAEDLSREHFRNLYHNLKFKI